MEQTFDDLVDRAIRESVEAQGGQVISIQIPGPELNPERDTVSPGTRLRCAWEVMGSVIPQQPMPEFTRRWILTSEQWEKDLEESAPIRAMSDEDYKAWLQAGNHYESTFQKYQNAAMVYAQSLQNPQSLNWVTVNWIWY